MGKYETNRKEPAAHPKELTARQIASRKKAIKKQRIAIIAGCSVLAVLLIALIIGILAGGKNRNDDG